MLVSICIPAYKNVAYLSRLLDSVQMQEFRDFEVIVTDDSPGDEVQQLCDSYSSKLKLLYKRNHPALGTPENWNEAVRRASGTWIKLMHDDDWFVDAQSLEKFVSTAENAQNGKFLYSAYYNIKEGSKEKELIQPGKTRRRLLSEVPFSLFAQNSIGPPSVTLYKKDDAPQYDKRMKWFVDIDFYLQILKEGEAIYINEPLVNVGISSQQVTQHTFRVQEVEIPEAFLLLQKTGTRPLKHLLVYDGWWRFVRNLKITNLDVVRSNGYSGNIPAAIQEIIRFQRHIPSAVLNIGVFSKCLMFLHYIFNKKNA